MDNFWINLQLMRCCGGNSFWTALASIFASLPLPNVLAENYHESLEKMRHCSSKDYNLLRRQMSRVSRSDQSSTLSWESGRSFPISRILNLEPLLTSQNNCNNCDFDCHLRFLKIAKFKKKWGWKPNFERLKAKKKYCYHLHFFDTLPSPEFRSYIQ